jgi:hypothetical protein
MTTIDSFIRDCKRKFIIIIDSWNTYLWNEKPNEKLIDYSFEQKITEILVDLQTKYNCICVICRKTSISQSQKLACSLGTYPMNNHEKKGIVSKELLILEPIISQNGKLLHALCTEPFDKIYIFTHPFEWLSREKVL